MDVARERLIGTLERLSADLTRSGSLAECLRRLPRADYHGLYWHRRTPRPGGGTRCGALTAEEGLSLARMALAAGAQQPEQLAERLAELAADLRRPA